MNVALTLGVVLAVSIAASGQIAECGHGKTIPVSETRFSTIYTGEYCNYDYAYAVKLPVGVVAQGTKPPNPNHGFGLDPEKPQSRELIQVQSIPYLWVDASYGAECDEWHSVVDVVDCALKADRDEPSPPKVLRRQNVRLGTLQAIRAVRRRQDKNGNVAIEDNVFAVRSGIVYTISLLTTPSRYEQDRQLFEKILAGFSLQPMPKP